MYRSPNSNRDNDVKINTTLQKANSSGYSHVLVCGDFNHPSLNWRDSTSPMEKESRSLEDKFAAFCEYMDSVKYYLLNKKHHSEAGKTRKNSVVKATKNGQYVLMNLIITILSWNR